MWRTVAIGVVLAGMLAGCSWDGSGAQTAARPAAPTSDDVTSLVKPIFAKVGGGEIGVTKCAVEPHLRAKCDFGFFQGVGDAVLFSAWFHLRATGSGWSVDPICQGARTRVNPLCPHNDLHLGGTGPSSVGQ